MQTKPKLDPLFREKIQNYLKTGKKVEAIMLVQQTMNLGLKGSKELVDSMEKK
jgi:ribosomal protein L7/L12